MPEKRKGRKELLDELEECRARIRSLERAEDRYRTLVETINEVIFELDENGTVVYVSPSGGGLRGYVPSDIIGRPFTDFVYHQDLPHLLVMYERIKTGPVPLSEYRLVLKSGELLWVQSSSRALLENGKFQGLRGTLTDITEKKRMEEDQRCLEVRLSRAEKLEALGMLAGGVAHDINNVLGGMIGYSELLLLEIPEDDPCRKIAAGIFESGQKAAAIVNDLLTLSRRGVPSREVFSLNRIINNLFETPHFSKLKTYHPEIRFNVALGEDMAPISGSPVHLEKTIMNLLSNAAESMPEGGEVTIRTERRYLEEPVRGNDHFQAGVYAVLTVSDNGIGMSEEETKRIFEPFYTKKKMGRSGTGLGLTVVWGTVKDHGGYIEVNSREGCGSSFTLYFPATPEALISKDQPLSKTRLSGKGEFILIVDDMEEQRRLAAAVLQKLGYQTHCVSSGEEALKFLESRKADLMVLDMIMDPGIDGLETYRKALTLHPGQKAVIISGFSETDRVRKAQEIGAGAYVRKPYVLEKFGDAVRSELDRSLI